MEFEVKGGGINDPESSVDVFVGISNPKMKEIRVANLKK